MKIKHQQIFIIWALLLFNTSCAQIPSMFKVSGSSLVESIEMVDKSIKEVPQLGICLIEGASIDPESYTDLWPRVASQLKMAIPSNNRFDAQRSWYAKHPSYLKRVSKRSSPYLYFIVTEIEKRQLPMELVLLPIVESAFDPFAYSHGRAAGMWQFVPATGKSYGLKQNWWYDGRRDVYLSTLAALDYLTYLNKRFKGDWLHALAAYNSGEGNVRKAIRQNKKIGKATDFWSLNLPKETKAYVPKLLALADLLNQAIKEQSEVEENESNWSFVANQPYFHRVSTESQIDLSLIADLSEQKMSDFYQLNPAFNRWATHPSGPHFILLPISKVDLFKKNLKNIPVKERIAFKRYKIKPGDSLNRIASKNSTTVELLRTTNNIKGNSIREGKTLLIPKASKNRSKYIKSNQQRLLAKHQTKRKGKKLKIKVKSGDSFWTLSRHYKVNLRSLAKWNNMAPRDPLKIGQTLVLWITDTKKYASLTATDSKMSKKQKLKKIHYMVRNGDSFARIASKFNTSINKIQKWNRLLSRNKYLQPGQSVTLFVDVTRLY
ncbi:MAG: membrane-bound lytic murein transglycosylase D [Polaribacter sp.]